MKGPPSRGLVDADESMNFRLVAAAVALSSLAAASLSAQAIKRLGLYESWEANVSGGGAQQVCFMVSEPSKKEPADAKRGTTQAFVSHRPGEKARDVVSVTLGYPIKPGSDVRATVGNRTFDLFTKGETAWAKDNAADKALVTAMTNGSTMAVAGESERGTKTVDTYSLKGFSAAYKEIGKACGIK
jgi:hypothetical protein